MKNDKRFTRDYDFVNNPIKTKEIFRYIVGSNFISDYCPNVKSLPLKQRGVCSKNKPIDFTHADKQEILAALDYLCSDMKKIVKQSM